MSSGKEKSIKKQRLAPLCKSDDESSSPSSSADPFQFTDDMLEEMFNEFEDKPANTSDKASTNPKVTKDHNEMNEIDLDDWIPPELLPRASCSKSLQPAKEKHVMVAAKKSAAMPPSAPTFASRKEMMFSSIEFEADSTLGLRFTKRFVPAAKLKEWVDSLKQVNLYNSLKFTEGKDWYTFGVVSEYGELRKAGGGRLDVTDLAAEPYIVRFLLFGSAFSDLGKIAAGSIVCISRPKKGKEFNGRESLIINNSDQVLVAGSSRDFGLCGGKKKSGGVCRAVVNIDICRYCKYHAMAEYKDKKMALDMKAAAAGVGLGIKTPASAGLWNANANQARFLNPAKKNVNLMKKDNDRMSKLNSTTSTKTLSPAPSKSPSLVVKFNRANESLVPAAEKRKFDSRIETSPIEAKKPLLEIENKVSSSSMPSPSVSSPSPRLSAAKRKALQYVRDNGVLSKDKPKAICQPFKEEKIAKPTGITEEFLALMKEKPRDEALLNGAEALEREKTFERLQIVEEIGEKLAATHEVPVRAIRCLVCNKNFHQMPMQCVLSKHGCKVVTGTKRYFECNSCRARTSTLERMPALECSKCGKWSWRKSGVAPSRVCNVAPQLAVRGLEEKFVNSIVKDPNLNLLMPDESLTSQVS